MLENLKNRLQDRFVIAWASILLLVILAISAKFIFAGFLNPSIEDVLSRSPQNGFDFSMFVASLLALSLATISAAKGYEIVKRNHSLAESVLGTAAQDISTEIQDEELVELKETICKLERCCGEVGRSRDAFQAEAHDLREQLDKLVFDLGEVSRAEQMLRKSNISLSRECERLGSENESLRALKQRKPVKLVKAMAKVRGKKKVK